MRQNVRARIEAEIGRRYGSATTTRLFRTSLGNGPSWLFALDEALKIWEGVSMREVREKSIAQTSRFLERVEAGVAGDPDAGIFMAGWFAVMMFGLPAAAYAIYRAADDAEKKNTGSIMASAGFTSFLTGITEPIEFSFAYAAPVLFAIHGLLAGIALGICAQFDWMSGFGFSAGLIDYLLNFTLAKSASSSDFGPIGILIVGAAFAALTAIALLALVVWGVLAERREHAPGSAPVAVAK